jgi:hypothetical protein
VPQHVQNGATTLNGRRSDISNDDTLSTVQETDLITNLERLDIGSLFYNLANKLMSFDSQTTLAGDVLPVLGSSLWAYQE